MCDLTEACCTNVLWFVCPQMRHSAWTVLQVTTAHGVMRQNPALPPYHVTLAPTTLTPGLATPWTVTSVGLAGPVLRLPRSRSPCPATKVSQGHSKVVHWNSCSDNEFVLQATTVPMAPSLMISTPASLVAIVTALTWPLLMSATPVPRATTVAGALVGVPFF